MSESGKFISPRSHSTAETAKWHEDHYEVSNGISIPRGIMHTHYVQLCEGSFMRPVNAASVGKIVLHQFPGLKTLHLGTRGLSQYQYNNNGLELKWEAQLLSHLSRAGLSYGRSPALKIEMTDGITHLNTREGLSRGIFCHLPQNLPREQVEQLYAIYMGYFLNLVEYAVTAEVDDAENLQNLTVRDFIVDFWKDLPTQIMALLENNSIMSLLGIFDTLACRAISNCILPTCRLGEISRERTNYLLYLTGIIIIYFEDRSGIIWIAFWRFKIHSANMFRYTLKRLMALTRLCMTLNEELDLENAQGQMLQDWVNIDMVFIIAGISFIRQVTGTIRCYEEVIWSQYARFEAILRNRTQICSVKSWLLGFIKPGVIDSIEANNYADSSFVRFKQSVSRILLLWSAVGTRVLRELTLSVAPSFGTFNLLYQVLADCGAHLVESIILDQHLNWVYANISIGSSPEIGDPEIYEVACNGNCSCQAVIPTSNDDGAFIDEDEQVEIEGIERAGIAVPETVSTVLNWAPEVVEYFPGQDMQNEVENQSEIEEILNILQRRLEKIKISRLASMVTQKSLSSMGQGLVYLENTELRQSVVDEEENNLNVSSDLLHTGNINAFSRSPASAFRDIVEEVSKEICADGPFEPAQQHLEADAAISLLCEALEIGSSSWIISGRGSSAELQTSSQSETESFE